MLKSNDRITVTTDACGRRMNLFDLLSHMGSFYLVVYSVTERILSKLYRYFSSSKRITFRVKLLFVSQTNMFIEVYHHVTFLVQR